MMSPLFKKLNLGSQKTIHVLHSPVSFETELGLLEDITVERTISEATLLSFGLAFVCTQAALDRASTQLAAAAEGDAILWIAYPKQTSKTYQCEFNRDSGWTVLVEAGFDTVRQVALDDDWTALRFRRTEFITRRSAPLQK